MIGFGNVVPTWNRSDLSIHCPTFWKGGKQLAVGELEEGERCMPMLSRKAEEEGIKA